MNSELLKSVIVEHRDTQRALADALGLAPATLNLKINGKAAFRQDEINAIYRRYSLTQEQLANIFFAE